MPPLCHTQGEAKPRPAGAMTRGLGAKAHEKSLKKSLKYEFSSIIAGSVRCLGRASSAHDLMTIPKFGGDQNQGITKTLAL